ncbi:MAG: type II toxin-antitoxin system HicA family toxin [Candidatus Eremiobacteraeota bacterium]|nr:type II toxin-antitoxin system HicA family toxin [Candidatus Eremiobacteraeota bacterium]
MKAKDLVRYAESKGWTFVRSTASHRIYRHPALPYIVSIPSHGSKDIPTGTLVMLRKQIDGTWGGRHS